MIAMRMKLRFCDVKTMIREYVAALIFITGHPLFP
jgi:hypothetical protein